MSQKKGSRNPKLQSRKIDRRTTQVHRAKELDKESKCDEPLLEIVFTDSEKRKAANLSGVEPSSINQVEQREWLSISEAAQYSSLSKKTIRRAIRGKGRDQLPAYNVGLGRRAWWRIKKDDLEKWLKRNEGGESLPLPASHLRKKKSRYFSSF